MIAIMSALVVKLFEGGRAVALAAGETAFLRDQPVREMSLVRAGRAHLLRHTLHGGQLVLQDASTDTVLIEARLAQLGERARKPGLGGAPRRRVAEIGSARAVGRRGVGIDQPQRIEQIRARIRRVHRIPDRGRRGRLVVLCAAAVHGVARGVARARSPGPPSGRRSARRHKTPKRTIFMVL